ncbi:MAG: DUF2085 domain-containing protein [Promethearchaeota archaeon]
MSEKEEEYEYDTISDEEIEGDEEALVRSRIHYDLTILQKIKRIAFWALYIMAFYYFASMNSGYLNFLEVTGTERVESRVKFLMGLLVLVVFGNIAGPIAGGIGALLGDLVYQLATIKRVRPEYLLIAVLLGAGSGIFRFNKDETLKQMKVMKLFYSLVGASLVSLGFMFLIAWIRYPTINWDLEIGKALQFNYIQFFFSELLTYLFFGPLLIALIDRVLRWASNPEGIAYRFFFTHHYEEQADHAIPLDFGGYQFFVCTRCSGTVSGIIFMVFIDYSMLQFFGYEIINPTVALIFCIVFTLPALADWGTQKMQYRTSNDIIRLITGLFLGAAIHLLVLAMEQYVVAVIIILVVSFTAFFIMFFLGNRRLRKMIFESFKKSYSEEKSEND